MSSAGPRLSAIDSVRSLSDARSMSTPPDSLRAQVGQPAGDLRSRPCPLTPRSTAIASRTPRPPCLQAHARFRRQNRPGRRASASCGSRQTAHARPDGVCQRSIFGPACATAAGQQNRQPGRAAKLASGSSGLAQWRVNEGRPRTRRFGKGCGSSSATVSRIVDGSTSWQPPGPARQ
jgi:hypothetical protein